MQLPDDVMHIIFTYVHQLRMRRTIVTIVHAGVSDIEDMPDLISDGSGIMWSAAGAAADERPGWSRRVSEFRAKAGRIITEPE